MTDDGIRARFTLTLADFALTADVQLPGRGVTVLFGPSGSGKTLFLRTLAGLEHPRDGYIAINGEIWQDKNIFLPAHRRAVGYVFQESNLFPHLSVRRNLEFGWKRAANANNDIDATARLLGIEGLLTRDPSNLSGGERQRVAIARALLASPRLLLLDEPLASLDVARRREILPYLERLRAELHVPCVYVTHMPDELARLADHVVLLDRGTIVASGPLHETLARLDLPPAFAADRSVVIETTFAGNRDDRLMQLDFAGGSIHVPQTDSTPSDKLRCRIEARDVSITLEHQAGTSILNIIAVTIVGAAEVTAGAQMLVRLDANGTALLALITKRSWQALGLAPGERVFAQIKAAALVG
jgi:molybdate transport system ATP-binding protein